MAKFGRRSMKRLSEAHEDLQAIAHELIKVMDVAVLCGHRTEKEQNAAFHRGNSKLMWPRSKHNKQPAEAMDLAPYPIDWADIGRFNEMCDHVERIAKEKGIKVRMGRDFSFKDYPHVELSEKHKKGRR
jgi:peptidoglycan L-alanyl-D-glutamate endopeptidase CwlK